ncbi:MAG TPA: hypothetical protein VF487_06095 [Chitinophagaceae bacterium]
MNINSQARKVLQYLYKHRGDNGHIYGSISFNLGLGSAEKSEEICKTLYTDGLAEFRNDRAFISDSGIKWIEHFYEQQNDRIRQFVYDDYDFALLRFLYEQDAPIKFEEFPEIFVDEAPKKTSGYDSMNFHHMLEIELRKYIDNPMNKYQLNLSGRKYFEHLVKTKNSQSPKTPQTNNIIHIHQMINSAIQQSTSDSTISIKKEQLEEVQKFLTSIDTKVDFLTIENAFIHNLGNAQKLAIRYFDQMIAELKQHQISPPEELNMYVPWGDKIEDEVIKMIGLRNRMLSFFVCVYENSNNNSLVFECLKKLMQVSYDEFESFERDDWGLMQTDHTRIFIYSIFLYLSAYLAKNEMIEEWCELLNSHYQVKCVTQKLSSHPITSFISVPFIDFNLPVPTINDQNRRYKKAAFELQYKNLYADLIHSMHQDINFVSFDETVDIDILLFFISLFWTAHKRSRELWVPNTSVLRKNNTSELMLKSASVSFFKRTINIFGINSIEEYNKYLPEVLQLREKFTRLPYTNLPKSDLALYYHYINKQP